MSFVDTFLNKITMYRLVLYYVAVLFVLAIVFGVFHLLPVNPLNLVFSTLLILAACWSTNIAFAKSFGAIPNVESVYITAFILALILTPVAPTNFAGIGFLVFVSVVATASKYIVALGKKHIFNPAAFGVAVGALALGTSASWWVAGNIPLLPFVLVGGLLIVRKIRRFDLVLAFTVVAFVTVALTARGGDPITAITQTLLHSAFFFLAGVMLTEPLTLPPNRWLRLAYGGIVAFLFTPNIHLGSYYFPPEVALLVGNLFAYLVSPKGRYMLALTEKKEIALGTYELVFTPDRAIPFSAGQYLEWTLPAGKTPDARGNRRFFTIASSPSEPSIRLGVKYYTPASTFKTALMAMQEHDTIAAAQIAGDFVLPKNKNKKLVWIAGGIGVTPFRSMAQHLLDTNDSRAVTLFYSNKTVSEIAYRDIFTRAADTFGMKTVYAVTDEPAPLGMHSGFIDGELIKREVPDYRDHTFYISGPHGMVEAFKTTLRGMGVSRFNIKADYFPGFV